MVKLQNRDPNVIKEIKDEIWSGSSVLENINTIISDKIIPPFSIAIDGEWGSGKTTLLKLAYQKLEEEKYPVFWFNPWEYKESSNVVLSFLQKFVTTFAKEVGLPKLKKLRFISGLLLNGFDFALKSLSLGSVSVNSVNVSQSGRLILSLTGETGCTIIGTSRFAK